MNISSPFIKRHVATTLLTLAVLLLGAAAFRLLPVAPLPQVDFPTISVSARQPGASPETMAATVATPLERTLGRIAGVTEITSSSSLGTTRITLQFDLGRDIDGAAREVQAAINAARSMLPALPANPTYRKVNPADSPIMILGLTSDSMSRAQMYDAADSIISQKLLQIPGVGDVAVGGGAQPGIRVAVNPTQLAHYNLDLEDIRSTLSSANNNSPKGYVEQHGQAYQIQTNDQLTQAADYLPLIVNYQNGAAIRLADVAKVEDSVSNVLNMGMLNNEPAIMLVVFRQPGANIIDTVDRIREAVPRLQQEIPAAINMKVVMDRSPTIRASLREVEHALLLSVCLVVMVVFLFLRNLRATMIPAVTVPVSLVGTFAVMYLLDFSLNNISLMALTIATGFVVDDAVVVLENIARHIEEGKPPLEAAVIGAKEVAFTVVSMSVSLVVVFTPILLMGGIVGRLLHEFAVTLSAAILISLVVSLTTTPMLCARWLKPLSEQKSPSYLARLSEKAVNTMLDGYRKSLAWALEHSGLMLLVLGATVALNVWLFNIVPKGFFPQQDTGVLMGSIRADQSTSFQAMNEKLKRFMKVVGEDPAVENVMGTIGSSSSNSGSLFVALKPLSERQDSAEQVIRRLRGKLADEPGASLYLQAAQDIRVGGRSSSAQYQYTLQGDNLEQLREWVPKVLQILQQIPGITQVNSDLDGKGLTTELQFNRDAMARLGVTQAGVNAVLNDAFSQRQVSPLYRPLNQYRVVMVLDSQYLQTPEGLNAVYVNNNQGEAVPLSAFASWVPAAKALSVNHQSGFAAATLSFNLQPGIALSDITADIERAVSQIGLPGTIIGGFKGTAQTFQQSLSSQPFLIAMALLAVYLVLGMLYESLIHPVTILSTLPSAGVGALLALMMFGSQFDVIALIGILLLIGIVKKNAIMMVDFALVAEREQGLSPRQAIFQACLLRFRPIMMTTLAALFGALPLALARGDGAELRTPLGISIAGGLVLSQLLTLYTTPVVYLLLDKWRHHANGKAGQLPQQRQVEPEGK
ncbi:MAG: multidrug efflux RND transporter permease subunit [Neisseria sp.]|uniref:multidrug efflux RND transporter permease subunit n=1 Tax=Neisseria sp. TaxID=192066 RepID=UPI0026DACB62|nr:multidrug efflux RND transporter permease subunit [Neisseria sp.]MDO4249617.1 multidrug efflux RND transporter permease subunit [Neisseria sp.]